MLVLSRYVSQRFLIQVDGKEIWIVLKDVRLCPYRPGKSRASIGIEAPRDVLISREELLSKPMAKPAEPVVDPFA